MRPRIIHAYRSVGALWPCGYGRAVLVRRLRRAAGVLGASAKGSGDGARRGAFSFSSCALDGVARGPDLRGGSGNERFSSELAQLGIC